MLLRKIAQMALTKRASDGFEVAAYVIGPSGAGKTSYVKKHYPVDRYFILHSDKYADKQSSGSVKINWERAIEDGIVSGKPIVIDAYHVNKELMRMAKDKILLDPGKIQTTSQLVGRRKKSLKPHVLSPEEKYNKFEKSRAIAKELGFIEKTASPIGRLIRKV